MIYINLRRLETRLGFQLVRILCHTIARMYECTAYKCPFSLTTVDVDYQGFAEPLNFSGQVFERQCRTVFVIDDSEEELPEFFTVNLDLISAPVEVASLPMSIAVIILSNEGANNRCEEQNPNKMNFFANPPPPPPLPSQK